MDISSVMTVTTHCYFHSEVNWYILHEHQLQKMLDAKSILYQHQQCTIIKVEYMNKCQRTGADVVKKCGFYIEAMLDNSPHC